YPGAPVLADVKASQVLFDAIAQAGGQPVMMETGHSLIKARLAETKAPLAGEMSGHIFFADRWYGFDDAIYVAVRLLGILGRATFSAPGRTTLQAMPFLCNSAQAACAPFALKCSSKAR